MTTYNPKYTKQQQEYRRKTFKRIGVDIPKEYYADILKPATEAINESVNQFIKTAITERIDKLIESGEVTGIDNKSIYMSGN
jgi:phenylalanyl-tRNA synthetase alpha subunit